MSVIGRFFLLVGQVHLFMWLCDISILQICQLASVDVFKHLDGMQNMFWLNYLTFWIDIFVIQITFTRFPFSSRTGLWLIDIFEVFVNSSCFGFVLNLMCCYFYGFVWIRCRNRKLLYNSWHCRCYPINKSNLQNFTRYEFVR